MTPIVPLPSDESATSPILETHVAVSPSALLRKMQAEVDTLHAWNGGGVVFGRKPFLGEFTNTSFRIRVLSIHNDDTTAFLCGHVSLSKHGSVVRYRIEPHPRFGKSGVVALVALWAFLCIAVYQMTIAFGFSWNSLLLSAVAALIIGGVLPIVFLFNRHRHAANDHKRLERFALSVFSQN